MDTATASDPTPNATIDVPPAGASVNDNRRVETNFYLGAPHQPYTELEPRAVEPDLRPHPDAAHGLAAALAEKRLLVIETTDLDHRTLTNQIACCLVMRLSPNELSPSLGVAPTIMLRRWNETGGLLDLDDFLGRDDPQKTKILLLPQAARNNLGQGGLTRLAETLNSRRHFAILTTEFSRKHWGIAQTEEALWHAISSQDYYDSAYLQDCLRKELRKRFSLSGARNPLDVEGAESGAVHMGGVPLIDVVLPLKDPARIRDFVGVLVKEQQPWNQSRIKQLVAERSGDRENADLWFRSRATREQLLTIGLLLFQGLPADQVFAGLETLMDDVWRPIDPLAPHFDYHEIDGVGGYFRRLETGGEEDRILSSARPQIFESAWKLYRRHILAALPAMAAMIRRASLFLDALDVNAQEVKRLQDAQGAGQIADGQVQAGQNQQQAPALQWGMSEWRARQLYGDAGRMANLQKAAVKSMGLIGRTSIHAIVPCLHDLASDRSAAVRHVVAEAIASLRDDESEISAQAAPLLLAVLGSWWKEGEQALGSRETRRQREALRATVTEAIGLASAYDPSNQMAKPLVSILERALLDTSPLVRAAVQEILPSVLALHVVQLEGLVRTVIAGNDELLTAASVGVARAYFRNRRDTAALVARWREQARIEAAAPAGRTAASNLYSLTARSVGAMMTSELDELYSPEVIFQKLSSILSECQYPRVRRHALIGASIQAVRNYDVAAPFLAWFLSKITLADRSTMVNLLVSTYLFQRWELTGGDERIAIGETRYAVWIWQDRPLTAIEEALYLWLQEWDKPVAQQVAAEVFAALAATPLDREERSLIARRRAAVPTTTESEYFAPMDASTTRRLGPLGSLALYLGVRGRELRAAIRAPFAQILWLTRNLAPVDSLLGRWRREAQTDSMRRMVQVLENALSVYRWRWPLVGAACVASWVLWLFVVAAWLKLKTSN